MNETVLQISWRSVALACLLAACSAEEGTDVPGTDAAGGDAMRLYSALDNPAEEGDAVADNDPVFIFWDFGDWLSQTATPNPYLVATPEQGVDAYIRGNAPYNTNHTYPDGNRRVVAEYGGVRQRYEELGAGQAHALGPVLYYRGEYHHHRRVVEEGRERAYYRQQAQLRAGDGGSGAGQHLLHHRAEGAALAYALAHEEEQRHGNHAAVAEAGHHLLGRYYACRHEHHDDAEQHYAWAHLVAHEGHEHGREAEYHEDYLKVHGFMVLGSRPLGGAL